MDSFRSTFTITNRMTQAITRIEQVQSVWHRVGLGHICDNFATGFATASCDRPMTRAVSARNVSRQGSSHAAFKWTKVYKDEQEQESEGSREK